MSDVKKTLIAARPYKNRELHGLRRRSEYKIWSGIIQRCENPINPSYKNYGGRGISMHKAWRDSFSAFLEYIGDRPSDKHSIDRINVDGNYEPGNVRWADTKTQARNTRANSILSAFGEEKCLSAWAEEYKLDVVTLHSRIYKLGLSLEDALTKINLGRRSNAKFTKENVEEIFRLKRAGLNGKQIGKLFGVSTSCICRLLKGETYAFDAAIEAAP